MARKLEDYLPPLKEDGLVTDEAITTTSTVTSAGSTNSGTATYTGNISQTGATTISTGTGAISLNGSPTVATGKTLAVTDADKLTVGSVIVPQHLEVSYRELANGSLADECFFIANRAYEVVAIREVHSTAGSDGGAVNLQVTKDTSTNAPGAGTDLLTNNANAGFDLKGTANTVQTGTLTGTGASLQLAAGDRLSVDFAGTLTALAGVVVTVSLKRI